MENYYYYISIQHYYLSDHLTDNFDYHNKIIISLNNKAIYVHYIKLHNIQKLEDI